MIFVDFPCGLDLKVISDSKSVLDDFIKSHYKECAKCRVTEKDGKFEVSTRQVRK